MKSEKSWETLPRRVEGVPLFHADAKREIVLLLKVLYVLFCSGLMKFFLIPKKTIKKIITIILIIIRRRRK